MNASLRTISLTLSLLFPTDAAGDVPNHRLFADGLTAKLYEHDNECSSSLGISMCFDLVYPGASGECATQIKSTLRYPDSATQTSLVWGRTMERITKTYDGRCTIENSGQCEAKKPTIEIANSIWLNGGNLTTGYASIVGDLSRSIDFTAQNAASVVNSWASEKTHGLIPSILQEGPISGDLVAVNAIYLNASWENQFEETATNEDTFYVDAVREATRSSKAHFMHMVAELPYVSLSGFQVLQLRYATSTLSMLIALPGGRSVANSAMSSEAVLDALASEKFKLTRMALALPKFRFESSYEKKLKTALETLGMVVPFGGGFHGLLENQELYISDIIQKTFINVLEKGTEAAAVTAIKMKITSVSREPPPDPVLFMADHPFQFWIYDAAEDVVLFEGRVGNPGIVAGSTAPSSGAHQDSDFWTKAFQVKVVVDGLTDGPSTSAGAKGTRLAALMTAALFQVRSM